MKKDDCDNVQGPVTGPHQMSESSFQLIKDEHGGFYRISPTPTVEKLRELYRHEYYLRDKPAYLEKTEAELDHWHRIWRIRLDAMAHALNGQGRLLDIGAGGGFFLDLARELGWEVAGIEPSLQSVAYAKKRFSLDLFSGYLEDYPQNGGGFNGIHLALVLEHVRDPVQFLESALKLLNRWGVLWVEVPNDFNLLQEIIVSVLQKPRWWVVPEHHLNYFDFESLSALLHSLGTTELDRMASFPMEFFPLMGLDYVGNQALGSQVHQYRMNFEKHVISRNPEVLADLYRNLARQNIGRTCNLLVRKTGT